SLRGAIDLSEDGAGENDRGSDSSAGVGFGCALEARSFVGLLCDLIWKRRGYFLPEITAGFRIFNEPIDAIGQEFSIPRLRATHSIFGRRMSSGNDFNCSILNEGTENNPDADCRLLIDFSRRDNPQARHADVSALLFRP